MKLGRVKRWLLVACALPSLSGCVHRTAAPRRPFPTIEEYSAGTSGLVSQFAAAFKAKDQAALERLFAPDLRLLPADLQAAPRFESPSGLRVERFETGGTGALTGNAARSRLLDERNRFQGIVRNEVHIAGIEGKGNRRTLRVHLFMGGIDASGARIQNEGWWRWEVLGAPRTPGGGGTPERTGAAAEAPATPSWTVVSMVEENRTIVTAPNPLFQQVYPTGNAGDWVSDSDRETNYDNTPIPGDHDTGGVALIPDCVDGGACLLFASGMGTGVLSRGRPSQEAPFENRAELLGLDARLGEAKSILPADFDNDGIPDLFISYDRTPCRLFKGQRLLEQAGDPKRLVEHLSFREVTETSGLSGLVGSYRAAVGLDADRDGRLDLYVVQFGDSTKSGPSESGVNGLPNRFFRNVTEKGGPIRFVDETASSGTGDTGWGIAASATDYDGDGRPDLYVANNFGRNVLYHNVTQPGGPIRFADEGEHAGTGERGSAGGVAWGDYDGDGRPDLYVTNYFADERWILAQPGFPAVSAAARRSLIARTLGGSLFHNEGGRGFERLSGRAGVLDGGWAWGAAWADVDGDGLLDLIVGNGMLFGEHGQNREIDFWNELGAGWEDYTKGKWTIDFGSDGITGPQPERLFLNLGDGTFAEAAFACGWITTADVRGLVVADINADGAPDIVGNVFMGVPIMFENMNAGAPTRVRVVLEGTKSNWDAVGAQVKLTAGGKTQSRQVLAGGSCMSDSGRRLEFSLAGGSAIDRIEVLWPSGLTTTLDHPQPRRGLVTVTEPSEDSPR